MAGSGRSVAAEAFAACPATRTQSPPPAVSGAHYTFPVRCASSISYGHSHHDYPATDIFAAKGCSVVAPVSGYVDEVSLVDTWSSSTNLGAARGGLSFSIIGNDGVRYYGSHLSAIQPGIRPGVRVVVGQLIGKVGNSGDARGIASCAQLGRHLGARRWPAPGRGRGCLRRTASRSGRGALLAARPASRSRDRHRDLAQDAGRPAGPGQGAAGDAARGPEPADAA